MMIFRQRKIMKKKVLLSITLTAVLGCLSVSCSHSLRTSLPRASPASQHFDAAAFDRYLAAVAETQTNMHSVMIVRNGKVVAEHWFEGFAPDQPHVMHSVSKTFTATAVGFAIYEGYISLTDKVIDFFPDKLPADVNDNLRALEIRHLLTMSSGHDVDPKRGEGDWLEAFFHAPFIHQPGTEFVYNNLATYVLSAIVQKTTGLKLADYLEPRLFRPLAIDGYEWEESPAGINCGGWGLYIKTEDMAKMGLFILQKGKWQGKQLLPEAWFDDATRSHIDSLPADTKREDLTITKEDSDYLHGYGYQIWRSRHNSFRAYGAYGQYILVLPELNAVIATTAQVNDIQAQAELNLIWDNLLGGFK